MMRHKHALRPVKQYYNASVANNKFERTRQYVEKQGGVSVVKRKKKLPFSIIFFTLLKIL
jgi:hypothetical protein